MLKNIKRLSNFSIDQENTIHNREYFNAGFISQPMDEPEDIRNIPHNPSVFTPLSADVDSNACRSFRTSSSCGPDQLAPAALKYCSDGITPTITDMFNTWRLIVGNQFVSSTSQRAGVPYQIAQNSARFSIHLFC